MTDNAYANIPLCPDCKSRNTRFNQTEQVCVCNRCGKKGTRVEFGLKE